MPSKSDDWNFGPSKPYLRGKNFAIGDKLTFNLVSIEKEDVDTDYGAKIQMVLDITTSSTTKIPPGEYKWNTICGAARKLRAQIILSNIEVDDVPLLRIIIVKGWDGKPAVEIKPFRKESA